MQYKAFFTISGLVGTLCLSWLGFQFAQLHQQLTSPKIQTQSQLEELIEIEKQKLGCTKDIEGYLIKSTGFGASQRVKTRYRIYLGGFLASQPIVAHEVYHICRGHLNNLPKINAPPAEQTRMINKVIKGNLTNLQTDNSFLYYFKNEPAAEIYETLGWDLGF